MWVADYVLAGYGTGAIMAVPAHDDRDFEFAKQFDLPIIPVVDPPADHSQREAILAGDVCFVASGRAINSGEFDGRDTDDVKAEVTQSLHQQGLGSEAVNYKLRDWLFSRQRFWGEPFPILHEVDADGNPTGIKRAVPLERVAGAIARSGRFQAAWPTRTAARQGGRRLVVRHHRRETLSPRDQHDAAVGRIVLVLLALHRSKERPGDGRPRERKGVDAGRLVCGRCRARRAALAVLAILAQGPV